MIDKKELDEVIEVLRDDLRQVKEDGHPHIRMSVSDVEKILEFLDHMSWEITGAMHE